MTNVAIGDSGYISSTDTAKLIRARLKREFPGVKFSVRTDKYAGGASINVSWTDGPTESAVYTIVDMYGGSGFDGMIDLKYSVYHWLEDDGTVSFAHTAGTTGSVPERIGSRRTPGARLVHFGANYIFTHRDLSDEFLAKVAATLDRKWSTNDRDQCQRCYRQFAPGEDGLIVTSTHRGWVSDKAVCGECAARTAASSIDARSMT